MMLRTLRHLGASSACLALCLVAHAAASAPTETVFVTPRQALPLLNLPQVGSSSAGTVATGDALTVVLRQGEFVQVRTGAGATGWVRATNLTSESPLPPPDLAADNARLTQQVTTLDAQVRAFQDENAQLHQRLAAVEAELALHTRAVPLTPAGVFGFIRRSAVVPETWIALSALLLVLALAFRFGVAHRNQSIRQRFGGLDL